MIMKQLHPQNAAGHVMRKAQHRFYRDDDIIKEDGKRYCAHCGGCKDFTIEDDNSPLDGLVVPVACKCLQEKYDEAERQFQAQQKADLIERRRSNGLRNKQLRGSTFDVDQAPNSKVSKFIRRYVECFDKMLEQGIGMIIYGTVGTGKSFYAASACNALIDRGYKAFFVEIAEILSAHHSNNFQDVSMIDHQLKYADLVVLDDLGAERETSYAREIVVNALNDRLGSLKPTIITTNYSKEDIENPMTIDDGRLFDRVKELCPLDIVLSRPSQREELKEMRQVTAAKFMREYGA